MDNRRIYVRMDLCESVGVYVCVRDDVEQDWEEEEETKSVPTNNENAKRMNKKVRIVYSIRCLNACVEIRSTEDRNVFYAQALEQTRTHYVCNRLEYISYMRTSCNELQWSLFRSITVSLMLWFLYFFFYIFFAVVVDELNHSERDSREMLLYRQTCTHTHKIRRDKEWRKSIKEWEQWKWQCICSFYLILLVRARASIHIVIFAVDAFCLALIRTIINCIAKSLFEKKTVFFFRCVAVSSLVIECTPNSETNRSCNAQAMKSEAESWNKNAERSYKISIYDIVFQLKCYIVHASDRFGAMLLFSPN